jgi:hypothetical protein
MAVAFAVMAFAVTGVVLSVVRSAVMTLMRSHRVKRQQGKDQRGGDR